MVDVDGIMLFGDRIQEMQASMTVQKQGRSCNLYIIEIELGTRLPCVLGKYTIRITVGKQQDVLAKYHQNARGHFSRGQA